MSRVRRVVAGFTLLELLVVLVLLALGAATIGPRLVGGGAISLDADARMVLAGLRRTKAQALRAQAPADFLVDTQARVMRAPGEARERSLSKGIRVGVVTARTQATGGRVAAIRFYPDGSSTGGRIALAAGELVKLVDVDWLTGNVRLLDAHGALDDALRTPLDS